MLGATLRMRNHCFQNVCSTWVQVFLKETRDVIATSDCANTWTILLQPFCAWSNTLASLASASRSSSLCPGNTCSNLRKTFAANSRPFHHVLWTVTSPPFPINSVIASSARFTSGNFPGTFLYPSFKTLDFLRKPCKFGKAICPLHRVCAGALSGPKLNFGPGAACEGATT